MRGEAVSPPSFHLKKMTNMLMIATTTHMIQKRKLPVIFLDPLSRQKGAKKSATNRNINQHTHPHNAFPIFLPPLLQKVQWVHNTIAHKKRGKEDFLVYPLPLQGQSGYNDRR
jgi:hypothetical protein